MTTMCNRCMAEVESRVELHIPGTMRLLVCGACAIAIATRHQTVEIRPFVKPAITVFVAGDHFYNPNPVVVAAHQRELEATATRYADRIRGVIERRQSEFTEGAA